MVKKAEFDRGKCFSAGDRMRFETARLNEVSVYV